MIDWFLRLLGFRKVIPALPAVSVESELEPILAPVPLNDVFLEAIQETYDEQYKAELELLNDKKLREYVKNMVKAMSRGINKDSYDFILLSYSDAKIDSNAWRPFAKIMIKLCAEIDLAAQDDGNYINVKKKDVKRAFDNLKKQVIDIDERTRAMLSQGIYR